MPEKINLSPDPRVLPILGEINLSQERCVAELIDNAIDAFSVLHENGNLSYIPEIAVATPHESSPDIAKITVRDNGPGMDTARLSKAVSAGWTGNDPVTRLGLFGMGFNISTARLGSVTEVWTTEKGEDKWRGVKIDFQKMIKERNFETDLLTRPKIDHELSGTEIAVTRLKPQQFEWFKKNTNKNKLKKFLGQVYAAALKEDAVPFKVEIRLNGNTIVPHRHCVWSDHQEGRIVSHAAHGDIEVFQRINQPLPPKKFCEVCWNWLPSDLNDCPTCPDGGRVIVRQRRVFGWLGILRYLSDKDYGIDFIRNGRKIELLDRSLFSWEGDNGSELEYPIDDLRNKGRIVGEIHINHCRVSYTKDRFERDDPAWNEMVRVVRGEGPLRPDIARSLGYVGNTSPLFLLYQVFRRSTPGNMNKIPAGTYSRLLAVPNNDFAVNYAKKFSDGEFDYQTDAKWYDLILEADRALLKPRPPHANVAASAPHEDDELADVLGENNEPPGLSPSTTQTPSVSDIDAIESEASDTPQIDERPVPSLSQLYVEESTLNRFDITAYEVDASHPSLTDGKPWSLESNTKRKYKFVFNRRHPVFHATSFLPIEALLCEMAHQIIYSARDQRSQQNRYASVLAGLRKKYHPSDTVDLQSLIIDARNELQDIANALTSGSQGLSFESLYESMDDRIKQAVEARMAQAGVVDPQAKILNGEFMPYTPYAYLAEFIKENPSLYFDGRFWSSPYESINFNDENATETSRRAIVSLYASLVNDLAWLAIKDSLEEDPIEMVRILRAKLSLEILRSYRDE